MSLGAEGLREVAETAVLNNNYLMARVLAIRGASAPYAAGQRRIEQVRYSWEELAAATGIHSDELGVRAADFGTHYWTSHHPFVVPEPMTLEPTESYSRADLDEYAAILAAVADEAYRGARGRPLGAAPEHDPPGRPCLARRPRALGDELARLPAEAPRRRWLSRSPPAPPTDHASGSSSTRSPGSAVGSA